MRPAIATSTLQQHDGVSLRTYRKGALLPASHWTDAMVASGHARYDLPDTASLAETEGE